MITRVVDGKLQIRCLTLKQPYAYFMFDLPLQVRKPIENRSRSITSEMGPMLIQTSALKDTPAEHQYFDTACEQALRRGIPQNLLPRFDDVERGVLYGCLNFASMLPKVSLIDGFNSWKFPGHIGYVCTGAVRLPSRPLKGWQTVFYVTLTDEEQELLRKAGHLGA